VVARSRGRLRWQLLTLACVFFALEGLTRAYAARRFIPNQRLAAAVSSGDGCVVFSGGSDMVSALDLPSLLGAWQGTPPCIADLALGAASPDIRFMAFREYLKAGRKPAEVVLGFKGHGLTDDPEYAPGYYTGNDAAVFEWGKLADFRIYYPRPSFTAFDNSLRFLLYRSTAIGAHRQWLWLKINQLEERFGLLPSSAKNRFGNVEAFRELEAETRQAMLAAREQQPTTNWQLMRWTAQFVAAAERAGVARVSFVRLPALAATERVYFRDADAEGRFTSFVSELARTHGGSYVDLARAPWVEDSLLTDGLHYTPRGAALISEALARALAAERPNDGTSR